MGRGGDSITPIDGRQGATAGTVARGNETTAERPGSLEGALERILAQVRRLVDVDAAVLLAVDPERQWVSSAASWFATARLRDALEPMLARRYDAARRALTEAVVESDRPLLVPRLEHWEGADEFRERLEEELGEHAAAVGWERWRRASVAACPVRSLERSSGALLVSASPPQRPLGEEDLSVVEALAELAGVALERSELLEARAARVRDEVLLNRATQRVSSSLEPQTVYRSIVDQGAALTGATKAFLARLQPPTGDLAVTASIGFSERVSAARHPVGRGMLGVVARDRAPYLGRSDDARREDEWLIDTEGVASFIHVPIELGPRIFGVITVAHEEPDRFGDRELGMLVKLARSSAAAIANALDFERERRVARALTRGFVPEPFAELPDFEAGLLYEPAASQRTGGDIYGVWTVPSGEVAMLVGDVAGKGVETAAVSAMVRFFVEARTWDSRLPSEVLIQANEMLRTRLADDTFVTAFFALLSPERIRYSNAGHLPPLLVPAAGPPEELQGNDVPLGVEVDPAYRYSQRQLASGDLLFAYTDGLVEARQGEELFGRERLARLVGERPADEPLHELVRSVAAAVRGWAQEITDDVVALALRKR